MADFKQIAKVVGGAIATIVIPGSLIALATYGVIKLVEKNKIKKLAALNDNKTETKV